jgi:ABC-type transport system involved in multi-copper enzyme maturation permease subunit
MGLNPIEYGPWSGRRSEQGRRFLVIANQVIRSRFRSTWLIAILVLGIILVHVLYLLVLSIAPHQSLTPETMAVQMQDALFILFTYILVSMVCSDLVSEDIRSGSLVLYLSRALKAGDYLLGKAAGAFAVISIYTLFMPVVLAFAVTLTQTGSDYVSSLVVVGQTVVAGLWTTVFLLPIGLLVSTLTKRKTYAAVGIFMTFFVLQIIGGIFSMFDPVWVLVSPGGVLSNSYLVLYGQALPSHVDPSLLLLSALVMTVPPLLLTHYRIKRKGVGK